MQLCVESKLHNDIRALSANQRAAEVLTAGFGVGGEGYITQN